MAPKPKHSEGEKVLCFHGPVLYEAKDFMGDFTRSKLVNSQALRDQVMLRVTAVTQISKDKEILYHVHYSGWNKSWDEWVDDERIVKLNEQGLQKQKELKLKFSGKKQSTGASATSLTGKRKYNKTTPKVVTPTPAPEPKASTSTTKAPVTTAPLKEEKESVSRSSTPSNDRQNLKQKLGTDSGSSDGPRRKKAKVETVVTVEPEEQFVMKIEVNIKLPELLKPVLVDDWDMVNRQKMLLLLPAEKAIDDILDEYYQAKVSKDKDTRDTVLEITKGIRDYFNSMVGTQLLYKFERTQYGELLKDHPGQPLTCLYGSVHLLRLFVKIGNMLAYTALDDKSMSVLITHVQDFLRWMSKNVGTLFTSSNYFSAPADYHRKALL